MHAIMPLCTHGQLNMISPPVLFLWKSYACHAPDDNPGRVGTWGCRRGSRDAGVWSRQVAMC